MLWNCLERSSVRSLERFQIYICLLNSPYTVYRLHISVWFERLYGYSVYGILWTISWDCLWPSQPSSERPLSHQNFFFRFLYRLRTILKFSYWQIKLDNKVYFEINFEILTWMSQILDIIFEIDKNVFHIQDLNSGHISSKTINVTYITHLSQFWLARSVNQSKMTNDWHLANHSCNFQAAWVTW